MELTVHVSSGLKGGRGEIFRGGPVRVHRRGTTKTGLPEVIPASPRKARGRGVGSTCSTARGRKREGKKTWRKSSGVDELGHHYVVRKANKGG